MKPLAWKDYSREGLGPFTRGNIKSFFQVLKSRAGKGAAECSQAVDYIEQLQAEATKCAKRAHLHNERAEGLLAAVDELRRQNADMRKLIHMQEMRLRARAAAEGTDNV